MNFAERHQQRHQRHVWRRRPAFERLLHAITSGKVEVVVAWHTDRIYRLPRDLERIAQAVGQRSVPLETCTAGPIDLNTPAGLLGATVHAAVARYEIQQKSQRQQAKYRELAREGKLFAGGPRPFGYRSGGMEVEPVEAKMIREATQRVIGGGSLMSIIRDWSSAGVSPLAAVSGPTLR